MKYYFHVLFLADSQGSEFRTPELLSITFMFCSAWWTRKDPNFGPLNFKVSL